MEKLSVGADTVLFGAGHRSPSSPPGSPFASDTSPRRPAWNPGKTWSHGIDPLTGHVAHGCAVDGSTLQTDGSSSEDERGDRGGGTLSSSWKTRSICHGQTLVGAHTQGKNSHSRRTRAAAAVVPWQGRSLPGRLGSSCSAPLLPCATHLTASAPPQNWSATSPLNASRLSAAQEPGDSRMSWAAGPSTTQRSRMKAGAGLPWTPLGDTFRSWDAAEPLRTNVDEGLAYAQGHVPHWGKGAHIRKKGALEHELTWLYYRMRRHSAHPLRKEVGETLGHADVINEMRHGNENAFSFWRDLRPPFVVCSVSRDHQESRDTKHPDGELFHVTYECGLDYVSERKMGNLGTGGTFDNKIHGVAQIRIPDKYPVQRPIHIVSWGRPMLNPQGEDLAAGPGTTIAPEKWMPIAQELGIRADHPRFAKAREASRKAKSSREVEVPELQRLLLGPHASLPRLAHVEAQRAHADAGGVTSVSGSLQASSSPAPGKKKRKHRIWTQAAGFVEYHG